MCRRQPGLSAAVVLLFLLASGCPADALAADRLTTYQFPSPGARLVSPGTNIIVRMLGPVDNACINGNSMFSVHGSASGWHRGDKVLSDDGRTILFLPHAPFSPGERVLVNCTRTVRLRTGEETLIPSFSFEVAPPAQGEVRPGENLLAEIAAAQEREQAGKTLAPTYNYPSQVDSVPLDFPELRMTVNDSPSSGRIFISNIVFNPAIANVPYLIIMDNSAGTVFSRRMKANCLDFKVQPDGTLTYYDMQLGCFSALDSSYAVANSYRCGNGYSTDVHDLRIMANGHAILMSYDYQKMDMSAIVEGGKQSATVIGLIIQEIDRDKRVVFQWRSWDHYLVTDATHEDLTAATIDYVHGNALEIDSDGNLLVSCRHMDEITKINRETGEIIWRWGGKNNQFTFINDTVRFSHQHSIRRLPNGDVTLFDNGNYHSPPFSRAVEYRLDEQAKTATLVWQYRNQPDIYGTAMGYVQRLENGNTLIGWGATNPSVTEVRPDGTKALEATFTTGIYSYRAYRYPWKEGAAGASRGLPTTYALSQNFPNPFNGLTTVVIDLPAPCTLGMKVYDLQGREVLTIADGLERSQGEYYTPIDLSSLASGVYFYRLTTENFSQTRKMVLMR